MRSLKAKGNAWLSGEDAWSEKEIFSKFQPRSSSCRLKDACAACDSNPRRACTVTDALAGPPDERKNFFGENFIPLIIMFEPATPPFSVT